MRLLLVTDQYAPMVGGVPVVTRALATGLAARGHQVTVLAPGPGPRRAASDDRGARIRSPGSFRWPWYADMRVAWPWPRAVQAAIAAAAPQVVHIHSPVVLGVLARRVAERNGAPVVYTNHYLPANVRTAGGSAAPLLDGSFYSWIVGFANRCRYVSAPTATALALLRERGLTAPSGVVSNGVDLAVFRPGPADPALRARYGLPAGPPLILAVSRLSGEKRLDVLLAAAARMRGAATLAIAGTGPRESRLRALAGRLGLHHRVAFLGHVPDADLPGLYRLADVFAIASEAELQSLATLEAMASGLPVVAADAGALGELVGHGRTGLLFPPGRADRLAECADRLAADQAGRRRMGTEGRRTAAGHARAGTLAQWEAVYGELAGGQE